MKGTTVVVFDFDRTMIEGDSDQCVIQGFGLTDRFNDLIHTMPWNSLMDKLLGELQEQGKTIEDIAACLRTISLDPNIISSIKSAYSSGCDLRVVSDSNMFYIETVLRHHGLTDCFSVISTNPTYVDNNARLRILPYHDSSTSVHGCALCPPNMCKGMIVDQFHASVTEGATSVRRFIYIGDGRGDYCPSLRLRSEDIVMPRKDYPLWNLIQKDPLLLRAAIHSWSNAAELHEILKKLIDTSSLHSDTTTYCNCVSDTPR